jgi:hypothetical protein
MGSQVVQAARADGGSAQSWAFVANGTGGTTGATLFYAFGGGSADGGLVMEVANQSSQPGHEIDMWTLNGGNNQQWFFQPQRGGWWAMVNVNYSWQTPVLALDVQGASASAGAGLVQNYFDGGMSQEWWVIPTN